MEQEFTLAEVAPTVVVRRLDGKRLRLRFQLSEPRQVRLRLTCFNAGWHYERDLGEMLPSTGNLELELAYWPLESTYVQALFKSPSFAAPSSCGRWLAAPDKGSLMT
jgi:hypothetical protein